MKKSLIFLCILVIAFLAFFDAKDRFAELDEVAANTPSQVEMYQMIDKPKEQIKNYIQDEKPLQEQSKSQNYNNPKNDKNPDSQEQFDKIKKRRNSINQEIN